MLFQRLLISSCERGVVGWVEGTWPNFFVHTIGKKIKTCGVFSLKFWTFNSQMLTFASSGQQAFSPTRGRRLEKPGNSALLIADMARNLFCFVSIKGSSWLWFCFLSLTISVCPCWPMSCSQVGVFHILCNSHILNPIYITITIQLHLNISPIIMVLSGWFCDALEENHRQIMITNWLWYNKSFLSILWIFWWLHLHVGDFHILLWRGMCHRA